MEFNISLPDEEERLRKAFRTKVPGLSVRFIESGRVLDVLDLSASGFAVMDKGKVLSEDQVLDTDLLIKNKLFLGGVKARVMRVIGNGVVGLNFIDMDRKEQIKLDKLVLEVQKRLIALRKKKREQG